MKSSHFKSLAQKTRVLIAGLTANLLISMMYIFLVTLVMRLGYESDEAQHILVGLALVAAMPIAGASTAWAQTPNGNLVLSLGLVRSSTVLSPIITPVAPQVFGEMASDEYEVVLQDLASYGSAGFWGSGSSWDRYWVSVEATDSQTGEDLGASIDWRGGGKHAWKALNRWEDAEAAFAHWAKKMRWQLCKLREAANCVMPE